MKQNVLIFPCGSEIGLEIYRSIDRSTHFNAIGGSSTEDHGKFVFKQYIGNIPFVDDDNFVDCLNKIIKTNKIDFIFPAHDSVLLKLAQTVAEGKLACKLIAPPVETCEIARSKLKTYEYFRDTIHTPQVYKNTQEIKSISQPIFLKPDVGQGSKGTFVARTMDDINFYTKKDPTLLLLEYLPGKEYTVDCFTNKNGQLLFCEGRERKRISNGISVNSKSISDKRFLIIAKKINKKLTFRGAWFFQVKVDSHGQLVLMEIAPRIAGTMALVRCKGVNLVLLSLFDALGQNVSIIKNDYNMVIDRALNNVYKHDIKYKHVYLDLDDLVIYNNMINPNIMAFIYQCHNNGVKIHLLTKHRNDLNKTLKKYWLTGVFDECILIKSEDKKHKYITEKEAIFIDDSFAERKQVYDVHKIPVLDSHMIEGLME